MYLRTVVNPFDTKAYGDRQKDLVIQNGLLFIRDMPKNCTESVLLFIIPVNKCQVAPNLCHHDARHQGQEKDIVPIERTILVAEDEDANDEQHTELQQVQGV